MDEPSKLQRGGATFLAVASLGIVGALVVLDLPPYAWFADAQAWVLSGSHFPVLSGLCTFIVVAFPILIAWTGVARVIERPRQR